MFIPNNEYSWHFIKLMIICEFVWFMLYFYAKVLSNTFYKKCGPFLTNDTHLNLGSNYKCLLFHKKNY